jgi:uncharacterized protein (UPF0264 family)
VRLLVSVRDAEEARAALDGGADIIDAKDPTRGALGAVAPAVLRDVVRAVGGARPVSAALGDATSEREVERAAREAASAGVAYVKVGLAAVRDAERALTLVSAAVRGAHGARVGGAKTRVIAVAYADAARAESLPPAELVTIAARAGAAGVLVDTAFKNAGGLFAVASRRTVAAWVEAAHDARLQVALAGKLSREDLPLVAALGANIAGVRGAACEGGRTGRVTAERVAALAEATRAATHTHAALTP